MEYVMKSGILTRTGAGCTRVESARIKGAFGVRKVILSGDGAETFYTDIREKGGDWPGSGLHGREYVLLDQADQVLASALPDYAQGEDPAQAGWPVYRLPGVDHAAVRIGQAAYTMWMKDSRDYQMMGQTGETVLRILHRGVPGGWDLFLSDPLSPEVLCALFVFSRYLEQENEFITV